MLSAWSAGSRQQAGLHQGPQQGDGTCGVAAGVADALRAGNARGLRRIHLRKAVNPLRVRAVGRAGVDHAHGGVVDGGDCFAGGSVGQAQDGDVAAVDGFGAAGGVLAVGLGQRQQLQVGAAVQALVDLQAGGALVAVNKNKGLGSHGADSWQGWEMGCGNLQRRSKI